MYKSAAVLGWLFLTFFTLKGEVGGVVNFLTFLRGGCKFSCISHTGGGVIILSHSSQGGGGGVIKFIAYRGGGGGGLQGSQI